MSIIGTWKVKNLMTYVPDEGMKSITVEEAKAIDDEDIQQMAAMMIKITEDSQMVMGMKLPPEMLEEAKAQGAPVTEDGMIIAQQHEWKEENGTYFYLSGNSGTIGDEEISPWEELAVGEDGTLTMMGGMLIFEKE